jgi:hypothetical protein
MRSEALAGNLWVARRRSCFAWLKMKGGPNRAALIERDADPELCSPHDMAGQAQSIVRHDQYETLRDTCWVGYLYRRTGNGQVADHAINRTADELDCSGFRDAVARCNSGVDDHMIKECDGILSNR